GFVLMIEPELCWMAEVRLPVPCPILLWAPDCRAGAALWPLTAARPRLDPVLLPNPKVAEEGSIPRPERRSPTTTIPRTPVNAEITDPAAMLKAWTNQLSPWDGW